jgi:peptide/nickel transport system substrate-binding protein
MARAAVFCRCLVARCVIASVIAVAGAVASANADTKVLRVAPENDIVLLDPVFGTAGISAIGGLMIYETLFTWDSKLQPRPEMVNAWNVSPDGLVWRFTLRDGLRFHDGQPVTTADVIPSLQRWMQFDLGGGRLASATVAMQAVDAATFEIRLSRPFPSMLPTLAAVPARFPAIMRAQDIPADRRPVTTAIGSGPFRYVPGERISGAQIVYVRNPDYVPRDEPPDGLAGGRLVKVDRVEWKIIPDAATVAAALQNGEVDFVEAPSLDLVPMLARNPDITVRSLSPLANQWILRPNHLQPPFNDARARQALNYVIDQGDEMAAGFGDPSNWKRCNSFFICGSPYGTDAGAEGFHQDFARARALLAEAGYKGERLVFIGSHDNVTGVLADVAADAMRKAGMNIDMIWMDWTNFVGRALKQGPVSEGGWNLRTAGIPGALIADPASNGITNTGCDRKNFSGWPCDDEAERLRALFADADAAARPALLDTLHRRLADIAPARVLGQSEHPSAWRSSVTGVLMAPWVVYWNIDKN